MTLSMDKVYEAKEMLTGVARRTNLVQSNVYENVYLKTENLQKTGSFKLRGAYYKISKLTEEERAKGVVACSAGNHAQGVALACQKLGIQATIFMPESAPISKVEATKSYGAEVKLVGEVYDDAYNAAMEFNEKQGATFIHPFNDETLMCGQGTVGLEIYEDLSDVDVVVVPVGGGGLISGVAYVIKQLRPECKIIGVEAETAASMQCSIVNGKLSCVDHVSTFADGIAVKQPGELTYKYAEEYVDEMVEVSDDEIAVALLELIEKHKLVTEGSGAVSYAAIKSGKVAIEGKKVALVLSGGNIDLNILDRVITRGLVVKGRHARFKVKLTDKPGQIGLVADIIGKLGGNILRIEHNDSRPSMEINSKIVKFEVETTDQDHIDRILKAIEDEGLIILER
ncbi:threonine ammonia-lyase [Peptoniphilus equinus]|uniref:L-threonine dehydratase catabolic TdcB n=1 Tax=Peptoniphilus equinus TaxID=3016343 RepID=A0ABY7QTZ7_9FIRM|nr:threonine ammonia-lyase [Peptoniphilus equinus]WBW50252.1 threonine ammonia-lyase [Peptoniphilus equinus]